MCANGEEAVEVSKVGRRAGAPANETQGGWTATNGRAGANLKGGLLASTDLDPRLQLAETTGLHQTRESFWWILYRRGVVCILGSTFFLFNIVTALVFGQGAVWFCQAG